MKVTGETFSFHHKRKRAEEVRYLEVSKLAVTRDRYRTALWKLQVIEAPKRQFLNLRKVYTESAWES